MPALCGLFCFGGASVCTLYFPKMIARMITNYFAHTARSIYIKSSHDFHMMNP